MSSTTTFRTADYSRPRLSSRLRRPRALRFDFEVAEPGWRLFMIAHFHYGQVVEHAGGIHRVVGDGHPIPVPLPGAGAGLGQGASPDGSPGSDYKFVLAELDYLKPYWDVCRKTASTSAACWPMGVSSWSAGPTTSRTEPDQRQIDDSVTRSMGSAISATCWVVRRRPRGSWTRSATTHNSQGSWPTRRSHQARGRAARSTSGVPTGCAADPDGDRPDGRTRRAGRQFPTEFDWVAPSGRAVDVVHGRSLLVRLVAGVVDHPRPGHDRGPSPVHRARAPGRHAERAAADGHRLLPLNRWQTAMERTWNARYVWPRLGRSA